MANLRFYLSKEILDSEEFKEKISRVGCSYKVSPGYIQFSNAFLHLQPSSFISDDLLKYLNEKATVVTLLVEKISVLFLMEGVQTSCNMGKFPLSYGQEKRRTSVIRGTGKTESGLECVDILCEEKSSSGVFDLFRIFAPGIFQEAITKKDKP